MPSCDIVSEGEALELSNEEPAATVTLCTDTGCLACDMCMKTNESVLQCSAVGCTGAAASTHTVITVAAIVLKLFDQTPQADVEVVQVHQRNRVWRVVRDGAPLMDSTHPYLVALAAAYTGRCLQLCINLQKCADLSFTGEGTSRNMVLFATKPEQRLFAALLGNLKITAVKYVIYHGIYQSLLSLVPAIMIPAQERP